MNHRSHLRLSLLPFIAIAAIGCAASGLVGASEQDTENPRSSMTNDSANGPELIAIKFHADWCGYCKAMGSVFEELQAKFDQEPVLYETFDQTREFNRTQSRYMAHAMELGSVWEDHGGKTGFVLLIDAESREVVQRLTHEQSLKQMGAALQAAVRSASATSRPGS